MMNYAGQCFELEQWFQPFGRENVILEHLRKLAEPWADECWIDNYGSLVVHQHGVGKRVMVAAQADVQTVVLTYIHEDGTARFLMTGKGTYYVTEGNAVRFAEQLVGVVEYDDDCQGASDWKRMRIRAENGQLSVGERYFDRPDRRQSSGNIWAALRRSCWMHGITEHDSGESQ